MSNNMGAAKQIESTPDKDYALRGKIMLSAITILFGVVIFLAILHLYVKWYLFRLRRRELQRRQRQRQRRRTHIVFYVDSNQPSSTTDHGLEADVLNSLPLFAYSPKTHPEVLECAVCLSEFEENETGRFLPKCSHFFHVECIDMWFRSHSTCPLCRSTVEPVTETEKNLAETVVSVEELGSSSGNNTASLDERTKRLDQVGVRIEIPRRTEFDRELPLSSPGFRSPGSRLMSFKRLLSMNKKSPMGTPGGTGTSYGAVGATELDLESGRNELTQESTEYIHQSKQVGATSEKRSDIPRL